MPRRPKRAGVVLTPAKIELGDLIRDKRRALGLSQSVLAERTKYNQRFISMLERGRLKYLTDGQIERLAEALRFGPEELAKFAVVRRVPKTELGRLIRDRRKAQVMSQSQLAVKIGVSRQFMNQIEYGVSSLSGSDDTIKKLAQALGLDAEALEAVRKKRRLKPIETASPLGWFLAQRRAELHLSRQKVMERVGSENGVAWLRNVEFGTTAPTPAMLQRLSQALECEIPPELVPAASAPQRRGLIGSYLAERKYPLGRFLTARRLELGLSQRAVAKRAGIVAMSLSNFERGIRPSPRALEKIAKALECEIPAELVLPPSTATEPARRTEAETPDAPAPVTPGEAAAPRPEMTDVEEIEELTKIIHEASRRLRLLIEKRQGG